MSLNALDKLNVYTYRSNISPMKLLIIGANGMLGHSLYRYFSPLYEVKGVTRREPWCDELEDGYSIDQVEKFETLFKEFKPDLVFNCVGVIKQLKESKDNDLSMKINSLWPHKLALMCKRFNAKMIHFSTDCIFTGKKGMYTEASYSDVEDSYGVTKYLGEVHYDNCLTLRTSIIGHEINTNVSLVDWFLSQEDECSGFKKAIYSGFPTVSIARIIDEKILSKFMAGDVSGLYHLSSEPINKFDLLKIIAKKYDKKITIHPQEDFVIDRSLDSSCFRAAFDFSPKSWESLVDEMHEQYLMLGRG